MTTLPHELNSLLYETVHAIVVDHKNLDITSVRELLKAGAKPKLKANGAEMSVYDLVIKHNHDGQFNAIVALFDEHSSGNPREMDSVGEGMHLKSDE
jgi:hypothetical protein